MKQVLDIEQYFIIKAPLQVNKGQFRKVFYPPHLYSGKRKLTRCRSPSTPL